MLPRLLVVLFVEPPNQLFEDRPHPVVVQRRNTHVPVRIQHRHGTQIDPRIEKLLDQIPQRIRFHQRRDLVPELELVQNLLHIRREPIQIRPEIRPQLLRAVHQRLQRKRRRVVERLPRCLLQRHILVDDPRLIQPRMRLQHLLLRRLQHRIQPPDHHHRQDHIAVLSFDIDIAQHIVRDSPNKIHQLRVLRGIHPPTLPDLFLYALPHYISGSHHAHHAPDSMLTAPSLTPLRLPPPSPSSRTKSTAFPERRRMGTSCCPQLQLQSPTRTSENCLDHPLTRYERMFYHER